MGYSVLLRRTRPRRMSYLRLWGFGLSVCFGGGGRWKVRDSVSGVGIRAWFSPVFLWIRGRQARGPRLRASLPPVLADPLGGVGRTFSHCHRWLYGDLRSERRGRFFQGRNGPRCLARRERGSFRQGSSVRRVPLKIVDLPSPDGDQGRGHGIRLEEMAPVACAAGRRRGRPLGWAWALSPRVGRVGFPGFYGSSLRWLG